jgi:uncharacterized LabA/DUF88 family protein
MTENNYAFIDSQNMHLGIRALGWFLDLKRFRTYLKDKYAITTALFFIGYVPGNESLYREIQEAGFICIFKPTMELHDGTVKGNVDADLVMNVMLELENFDRALLVTGDGDFQCLARYLLERNKLVSILVPNQRNYSGLFKFYKFRNMLRFMSDLKEKIGKRKDPARTNP